MIVISDTSPVRALHHLNLLHVLRDLYTSVVVPDAVKNELLRGSSTCPAIDVTNYSWFAVRTITGPRSDDGVPDDLDPGETEAIRIALELGANLVLMDERKGTAAARAMGLHTIGVFGVLLEAKRAGIVARLLPHVDELVSGLHFFVSPELRTRLTELAGE